MNDSHWKTPTGFATRRLMNPGPFTDIADELAARITTREVEADAINSGVLAFVQKFIEQDKRLAKLEDLNDPTKPRELREAEPTITSTELVVLRAEVKELRAENAKWKKLAESRGLDLNTEIEKNAELRDENARLRLQMSEAAEIDEVADNILDLDIEPDHDEGILS